ncbi:coiled-coil domain-containing protein 180 [Calypte anna]|nr:coiled-coil domain-containing protein 180 [Calypte anna]
MRAVGAVRLIPPEAFNKKSFEDEVLLARSLDAVRSKIRSLQSEKLSLVRDSEVPTDARGVQKWVKRMPCNDSPEPLLSYRETTTFQKALKRVDVTAAAEVRSLPDFIVPEEKRSNFLEFLSTRRRGCHDEAVTSMHQELASVAREMEPFVLEPGQILLAKLMESDRKIELLFKKIECDSALTGFSMEGLEELWNTVHQESLTRKKWIREMDESLQKVEWHRADKITDVLRKYTVILEEIAFFLSTDVYKFINNEAMLINRALLANHRAIAKLFSNLMKTELQWELSHRWKWEDRVKDWRLIQKNNVIHSFREFMANEEIQNPPAVRTEVENMIMDLSLLSEKRLEILQHLGDLLPPAQREAEMSEWYTSLVNLNKSIDTRGEQCLTKIHTQYEMVQQKWVAEVELCKNNLLNLRICTKEEAEEIVNSEFLQLTEKLNSHFEEELEQMDRDLEEMAKQNEENCRDLYSYCQGAMDLWDEHQQKLSQHKDEFQKKLDECRWQQDKLIQMEEDNLDVVLTQMRTASSEEKLKTYLEEAFSCLDDIRARYETFNQVLMDKVMFYPEDVLRKLFSYSISISQYFNVKEIFKQNLQGEIELTSRDQVKLCFYWNELVEVTEAEHLVEQQAESIVQENEGAEKTNSQQENETKTTDETENVIAQETEVTEEEEQGESFPHGSEETEHEGQGAVLNGSEAERSEIVVETFSTSSGNTYTILEVEEAGKTDIPETYLTKYEEESLPVYLKHGLIKETIFVELKKQIRLCFFEHLEKWFAEALSSSCVFVAAKKKKLNSELQQCLHLHQQRPVDIERNIYNFRAAELLLHKEYLEHHCGELKRALGREKAEFRKFSDQQNNMIKNLHSQISDMESVFLNAPVTEKFISFKSNLRPELRNHLEMIQVSLRGYRNYLDEAFGKLKDSNVHFLKDCRLFSDGGNFSLEEVKSFSKRLQAETKRIGTLETSLKKDMEKVELKCFDQASELINQSETKFHYIFMNRVFMEKSKRLLKNVQLQIRAEVAKSNFQAETLNSYLEKLHQKIDACAHPAADKEALTAEELYDFVKVVLEELRKRSQYLDCLIVKAPSPCDAFQEDVSPLATLDKLQGPIAVAIRTEHKKGLVMGLDPAEFPLLNPSRAGKSALDDLSVGVIKNLLEIKPPEKPPGPNQQRSYRSHSLRRASTLSRKKSLFSESGEGPLQEPPTSAAASRKSSVNIKMSKRKAKKSLTLDPTDKRFQIFEEEPPESDTFKGIVKNIVWTVNNSLLHLAEEFYQEANPDIMVPEDLPKTFECCAEMFKQKLLSFQSQTDGHYNTFLIGFHNQLIMFEKELPSVSQLAFAELLKEHEQKLSYSTSRILHPFNKQMENWEILKAAHRNQLHLSLGHRDNFFQLDALCQEEIKRQKTQADAVHLNTLMLQNCAAECAQNFVSALAALTEKLLLEFDESIITDDVQAAEIEKPKEKVSTLMRRKQAGLPLEIPEAKQLTQRGSRTWPGIPTTTLAGHPASVICTQTASVKTAKTTLGHVAAVEARDAVYKEYICKLEQQLAQIQKESTAQLLEIQRWEEWWNRSIQKIKQFYT